MYDNTHAPHGLMFHHFTDSKHPAGQGAITADQFADILDYAGIQRFLTPEAWKQKAAEGRLERNDLCITFDDALLCQIEIAEPVLKAFDLKAFWFVYSGVFEGSADRLEIYRHYRTVQFRHVDLFYESFFNSVASSRHSNDYWRARAEFKELNYLGAFRFYSDEDRFFRYMRDRILGSDGYFEIMDKIIDQDESYSRSAASELLWMKEHNLTYLCDMGHEVGLHSYSHPTSLASLSAEEQREEYEKNAHHLNRVLGRPVATMSHPCGSYDHNTLALLRSLGVDIGFISNMALIDDALCLPRQDHSDITIEMGMR